MESLGLFLIILMAISVICLVYLIITIPIKIAEKRHLSEGNKSVIFLLSWFGLLLGVSWIIALILAIVWPAERKEKVLPRENIDVLSKLYQLKEQGAISEEEFRQEKDRILNG